MDLFELLDAVERLDVFEGEGREIPFTSIHNPNPTVVRIDLVSPWHRTDGGPTPNDEVGTWLDPSHIGNEIECSGVDYEAAKSAARALSSIIEPLMRNAFTYGRAVERRKVDLGREVEFGMLPMSAIGGDAWQPVESARSRRMRGRAEIEERSQLEYQQIVAAIETHAPSIDERLGSSEWDVDDEVRLLDIERLFEIELNRGRAKKIMGPPTTFRPTYRWPYGHKRSEFRRVVLDSLLIADGFRADQVSEVLEAGPRSISDLSARRKEER